MAQRNPEESTSEASGSHENMDADQLAAMRAEKACWQRAVAEFQNQAAPDPEVARTSAEFFPAYQKLAVGYDGHGTAIKSQCAMRPNDSAWSDAVHRFWERVFEINDDDILAIPSDTFFSQDR